MPQYHFRVRQYNFYLSQYDFLRPHYILDATPKSPARFLRPVNLRVRLAFAGEFHLHVLRAHEAF